jgi:hypothetical protein
MALNKDFIVKQGIVIEGTATSYSTNSGSLIVGGGAGIAQNLYVNNSIVRSGNKIVGGPNGDFQLGGGISSLGAYYLDPVTNGTVNFSIINYLGTATLDVVNTSTINNAVALYIDGSVNTGSNNISIVNTWSVYVNSGNMYLGSTSVNTLTPGGNALVVNGGISGAGLYITGGGTLFGNFSLNGSPVLTKATQNQGNQSFSGNIEFTTSTQSTSPITGGVKIDGGLGVQGNIFVGGTLGATTGTFSSLLNSTSTTTGALILAGGIGIGQDLYASNGYFVSGSATTGSVAGNSLEVTNGGGLGVSGSAFIQGQVVITNSTPSALNVAGGTNIGGTLNVTDVNITDTSSATSVSTAPLTVAGGVGIGGNVIIASTEASTSTTSTNALYVAGGVGIGESLVVGGDTVLLGSLTLLNVGTQLTVNSTQTSIVDPVIDLGTNVNNTPLTTFDVFDKGIIIHYNNGATSATDNHAFMGYEHTQGRFMFKNNIYPGGIEKFPVTDLLNTGSYATIDAGTLNLSDTTSGTSSTGALTVAGGITIGENIYVGGNTSTFVGTNFNLNGIAGNTIELPNGGIGAQYLFIATSATINGANILTTATANGNIGGVFTASFTFINGAESTSTTTGAVVIQHGLGVGGNVNVGGSFETTGTVYVWSTLDSTSTTTGALVVNGGVGIGEDVNIGGNLSTTGTVYIWSALDSTGTSTGALVVNGGVGIDGDVYIGGRLFYPNSLDIVSTQNSTSTTTGALVVFGGVGIGENLNVGGIINATTANLFTIHLTGGVDSTSTTSGDLTVAGGVGIGEDVNIGGYVAIGSTATSGSTTQGALTVAGGAGIAGNLYVAGTIVRTGNVTSPAWGIAGQGLQLAPSTYTDLTSIGSSAGKIAVHSVGQPTIIGSNAPTWSDAATLYIDNSPVISGSATATSIWSLLVNNGQVKIASTAVNNGTTNTGALQVVGGVGVSGNITSGNTVKANAVNVAGNLITSPSLSGITTNVPQALDVFVGNTFRTAKYLVQITDQGTPNLFHVAEVVVAYDGSGSSSGVYISQYGLVTNTGELGSFDVSYSGGFVTLVFTPNYIPNNMDIQSIRMAITA